MTRKTTPILRPAALAGALSLLFATSVQAGADAPLPKDLPPYAPDKPLPVQEIAQKTLANGLTVWVMPREGLPRVDYVLAMRGAGHAADAADAQGFASMLAGMLSEGTTERDSKAIAEAAQGFGGSLGAGAGNDGITVYGDGAEAAAVALRGFGDRLRIARGGALAEHPRQHRGEALRVGAIGGVARAAHRQHVVHPRQAVARHHPHGQSVRQRLLRDLLHRQRLVGRVRRQFLRQRRVGAGLHA